MNLGQGFPDELKIAKIQVGAVILTHADFTRPPQNKLQLICCCDPLLTMLINSEINQFIQKRPELLKCQVMLKKEEHPFLDWDSNLNCIDAYQAYNLNFFKKECVANYNQFYKGNISVNCVRDIIYAVNQSETMEEGHKKIITRELNYLLESI